MNILTAILMLSTAHAATYRAMAASGTAACGLTISIRSPDPKGMVTLIVNTNRPSTIVVSDATDTERAHCHEALKCVANFNLRLVPIGTNEIKATAVDAQGCTAGVTSYLDNLRN